MKPPAIIPESVRFSTRETRRRSRAERAAFIGAGLVAAAVYFVGIWVLF